MKRFFMGALAGALGASCSSPHGYAPYAAAGGGYFYEEAARPQGPALYRVFRSGADRPRPADALPYALPYAQPAHRRGSFLTDNSPVAPASAFADSRPFYGGPPLATGSSLSGYEPASAPTPAPTSGPQPLPLLLPLSSSVSGDAPLGLDRAHYGYANGGDTTRIGNTTFYDYRTPSGTRVSGDSMRIGSTDFHSLRDTDGNRWSGDSMKLGGTTFHTLRDSQGNRWNGDSMNIGNTTFHSFRDSQGNRVTGDSMRIGNTIFNTFRDSAGNTTTSTETASPSE